MLTPDETFRLARLLMRFVNADDPGSEAISISVESRFTFHDEDAAWWRREHRAVAWAVRELVALRGRGGTPRPRMRHIAEELMQRGSDRVDPDLAYVPVHFSLSGRGELRPNFGSLAVAFGVTMAELMAPHCPVRILQCQHENCERPYAQLSGRKGRPPRFCLIHATDSASLIRHRAKQSKKRSRR